MNPRALLSLSILIAILAPLAAAAAESPAAPERVRFDDLPTLVRERNDHARAAARLGESAEALQGSFGRSFLPRVEARAGIESFRSRNEYFSGQGYGGVEARLNLFNGGRDRAESERRDAEALVARASARETASEELHKARVAYWEVLFQREMVTLIKQGLEANERYQAAAQQRVRAGVATDTDLLEFRMSRIELEQELARFSLAQAAAERELAVLVGFAPGALLTLDERIPHEHQDPIRDEKLDPAAHWSTLSSQSQERAAELEGLARSRWWAPALEAYGGYGLLTFREEDEPTVAGRTQGFVGLRLTLPLFDGGESIAQSRSKSLAAEGLRLRARQTTSELGARMERARAELKILHELLLSGEKGLPTGETYLEKTLGEYRRGVKNSPDVLGAYQRTFEMRRRLVELRKDYQVSRAQMLSFLER